MLIFNLPEYKKLAQEIARGKSEKIKRGGFEKRIFPNGESQLISKSKVAGENCAILGGISAPNELIDLLFLSDLLKKDGAKKVIAVVPYFSLSRQDKSEPDKSWGMKSLSNIFLSSKFDNIISLDLHNEYGRKMFKNKLVSIETVQLFADQIRKICLQDYCVIAPDEGAKARAGKLAELLRCRQFGYFKKVRTNNYTKHLKYHGDIEKIAVIYDDILDTGATLISAVKELRRLGFDEIYIFVTHGQFTGAKWKQLSKFGVKAIYATNSIPKKTTSKLIKELSAAGLIKKYLLSSPRK